MVTRIPGKIREKIKNYFSDVMKSHNNPHDVAMGFAVGVFIGVLPTPGLNIILGLIAAAFLKVNKVAIFGGIALNNPLTTPIIYTISYKIGTFFVGGPPIANILSWEYLTNLSNLALISKPIIVGILIFTVVATILAYILMYAAYYFIVYRRIKKNREMP